MQCNRGYSAPVNDRRSAAGRMVAFVVQVLSVFVRVSRHAMAVNVGMRPRWHGVVGVIMMTIVVGMHVLMREGVVQVPVVVPFPTMEP